MLTHGNSQVLAIVEALSDGLGLELLQDGKLGSYGVTLLAQRFGTIAKALQTAQMRNSSSFSSRWAVVSLRPVFGPCAWSKHRSTPWLEAASLAGSRGVWFQGVVWVWRHASSRLPSHRCETPAYAAGWLLAGLVKWSGWFPLPAGTQGHPESMAHPGMQWAGGVSCAYLYFLWHESSSGKASA